MQACALRKRGRQPDAPEQRASVLCPEISKTLSLEDVLIDAGFQIAGVAARLEKALSLIESGACDVAIIDANLAGVSASPAAMALAARALPFIVMSGYSPEQMQGEFPNALFIQKPCRPELIIETLTTLLLDRKDV